MKEIIKERKAIAIEITLKTNAILPLRSFFNVSIFISFSIFDI